MEGNSCWVGRQLLDCFSPSTFFHHTLCSRRGSQRTAKYDRLCIFLCGLIGIPILTRFCCAHTVIMVSDRGFYKRISQISPWKQLPAEKEHNGTQVQTEFGGISIWYANLTNSNFYHPLLKR